MQEQLDRPNVIIFPPLIVVLELLAVLTLNWFWPLPISLRFVSLIVGIFLTILGISSAAWGRTVMVRAGTNVSPFKPSTTIVTEGPFHFSRNPLYVGITSLFIGLSLIIGTWWGFIVLIPASMILHYGVIRREERYFEQKFSENYLSYKNTVRRYL